MIAEMRRTNLAVLCFALIVGILGLLPGVCYAQQETMAQKVQTAMELLKAKAQKWGRPSSKENLPLGIRRFHKFILEEPR